MSNQPIIESSVRTDDQGHWQLDINQELNTGNHSVLVTDENGHQDKAVIYVKEIPQDQKLGSSLTEFNQTNHLEPLLPPIFAYTIFIFLLIIIALSLGMVHLGNKIDKEITKRKRWETRNKTTAKENINIP